jgi:aspartate/methionine/tyrosine aminotransferase
VSARKRVEQLPSSKIRDIANASLGLEGLIPLWFGESDLPTPDFIKAAGAEAIMQGYTFYTHNRGLPDLREALSAYMGQIHRRPVDAARITVTASGCSAINLVQQILTDPGANIIVVTPIWPNLVETIHIMGGETRLVPLSFGQDTWTLDLDRLFDQVDQHTIALLINSPNNPTGWIMDQEEQMAVLNFCRQQGLWVISDEVYNRLVYHRPVSPSFLDLAEPEDKVIVVNSFSKTWAMSGWRLGWLTAPARLGPTLEKMIEFHYSCPAHFSQIAGITAVTDGESFIRSSVERYRHARDLCIDRLRTMRRVRVHRPRGTFYAFFAVDGLSDSVEGCRKLVHTARVGLAPGAAFGEAGEGFLRLCFANSAEVLSEALDRLQPILD